MIESSDRGITMAKPLAWTILASIVAVVWYGGHTVATTTSAINTMLARFADQQAQVTQIESRVRHMENASSRQDQRFEAVQELLAELKVAQRETILLLRSVAGQTEP
jgi:hypothetical protein